MAKQTQQNRLEHVSVALRFKTTSGHASDATYSATGNAAAKQAIDELARILAIDGEGEAALSIVTDAVQRVADYNKSKEPPPIPAPVAPDSASLLVWCSAVEQHLVSIHNFGPEAAKETVDRDAERLSAWHAEGKSALDAAGEIGSKTPSAA
ncbi:hypothetical protein [Ralstonia pseudosolanacearum]|uniref:hypothetical protein n=1 Tax=Ralstonia pseudosolanacearum TaxID=1310165 RepID=UPI003CE96ABC